MNEFNALFLWAMKKWGTIVLVIVISIAAFMVKDYFQPIEDEATTVKESAVKDSIPEPVIEYGFNTDSFAVYKNVIKPNEFLANILLKYKIPYTEIDQLANQSRDIFDVRKIAAGKNYTIFCSKDSIGKAQCFIYEPNAIDYVVFDMRDSISIYKGKKEVTKKKTWEKKWLMCCLC